MWVNFIISPFRGVVYWERQSERFPFSLTLLSHKTRLWQTNGFVVLQLKITKSDIILKPFQEANKDLTHRYVI